MISTIPLCFFMLYNDFQDVVNKQFSKMENRVTTVQEQIIESGGIAGVDESFFQGLTFTGETLYIDENMNGEYELVNSMPSHNEFLKDIDISIVGFFTDSLYSNKRIAPHEFYTEHLIQDIPVEQPLYVSQSGRVFANTSHSFEVGDIPYRIDMVKDITAQMAVPLDTFTLNFFLMLLWFFVLTVIGVTFCLRVVYNPLEKAVSNTFERIDIDQLHAKIEDPHYGIEVTRIVNVFNEVLAKCSDLAETNVRTMQDVSHEVRTHLTAMKQSVDMIKHYGADDKEMVEARLASIELNIQRATDVMEAILDLAKLQHSPRPNCNESHSALELWSTYTDFKKKRFFDYSVHVKSSLSEDDGICINSQHFYLALNPIVENAVKYSVDSNTILMEAKRGPNDTLEFSVTNNGRYIDPSEIPCLFDRYYRGKNIGNVKNGSGLGLTITKEVMNIYDGDIRVESDKSGRTTFTLIMPNKAINQKNKAS